MTQDKKPADQGTSTVEEHEEEVETHIDEAGRFDTGLGGTTERPAGTPSDRDFTTADSEEESD